MASLMYTTVVLLPNFAGYCITEAVFFLAYTRDVGPTSLQI